VAGDAASGASVSVVVPVLNAGAHLRGLLSAVFGQEPEPPGEVILVDSGSTDETVAIASQFERVRVVPIVDFSHGRSRNLGARAARGDIVVFLTQDAEPADDGWLRHLLAPFAEPRVGAACSRQVPRPGASPVERFFLAKRFPPESAVREPPRDGLKLRLEDVLFSNVSSAVRGECLQEHPFDESLIMCEDQQLSRDLLRSGHAVAYAAESVVVHSHAYTFGQTFKRYFDSAYALAAVLDGHTAAGDAKAGLLYTAEEFVFVLRRYPLWLPRYALHVLAKVLAVPLAHCADRLPTWILRRVSMHSYHWA